MLKKCIAEINMFIEMVFVDLGNRKSLKYFTIRPNHKKLNKRLHAILKANSTTVLLNVQLKD